MTFAQLLQREERRKMGRALGTILRAVPGAWNTWYANAVEAKEIEWNLRRGMIQAKQAAAFGTRRGNLRTEMVPASYVNPSMHSLIRWERWTGRVISLQRRIR